jgi:hypothetical protein
MVKAADAQWDARGGHDPTVTAASTAAGREETKGAVTPVPKVAPLPAQIFIHLKTLPVACVNFTITTPIGLTGAFRPVLGRKTNMPLDPFRFGGFPHTCHCHGYAFPCKRWLDLFD